MQMVYNFKYLLLIMTIYWKNWYCKNFNGTISMGETVVLCKNDGEKSKEE